ncbi:MAG TPA: mannose-1-phosphate guanylyltransferase [Chitinophagales bacterium]|nr:mannose-1-phosphate guanylyltransferase [Chitinophagales bacterium]HMU98204.1 mannose-1-phosphate guanylyltransferase [Chitinophagales bacterium]HMV02345.1 mannose-1-phosphate guanylyltransferase [Chitinophagales bacterium]HMW94303.1 mannose-1-phosphate guanylyltransferase [Chitinophagales bacterium]HMZ68874.1 mannose-1-phosphate guanylyltransferase [Chitinophagales bacterium]
MNSNTYVAIMAGGIGSRFWPASRTSTPKQFLDILGTGKSLIQGTYERFLKICPKENIFILTHSDYIDLIKEQLPSITNNQILAEPARKNTAPCIAYAAFKIKKINPNANIIVAPSDHIILNEDEFVRVSNLALDFVQKEKALVTLGIRPTRPDTGYGYIQYIEKEIQAEIHKVKTFTEKPNKEVAETFIESGDFLWNAGIFIWNVNSIIDAFEHLLIEVYDAFQETESQLCTENENDAIQRAFIISPSISIDYGILEKADNVYVVPASFGWSDLGTWASLYSEKEKDFMNNAVSSDNIIVYESYNNIIQADKDKLVVVSGLENYIIVDTDDVLLICKKEEEQRIKEFTYDIKLKKGESYL